MKKNRIRQSMKSSGIRKKNSKISLRQKKSKSYRIMFLSTTGEKYVLSATRLNRRVWNVEDDNEIAKLVQIRKLDRIKSAILVTKEKKHISGKILGIVDEPSTDVNAPDTVPGGGGH